MWWFKKTPKEKYESMVKELVENDIANWLFKVREKDSNLYYTSPSLPKWERTGSFHISKSCDINTMSAYVDSYYYKYDWITWYISTSWLSPMQKEIVKYYIEQQEEKEKIRKEEEKEQKRKKQEEKDREYLEKIQKLMKIKPLDADLKESFRKADRIMEINREITKLTKEIYKLRK